MKMISIAIVVLLSLSSMYSLTAGQSGITSSCTSVLVTLSPCLNYITGNSSTPSASCCTQLGTVVKSSPECLCEVVNSGGGSMASSLNINQTQALQLPNACKVKTPPLSNCNKAAAATPSKSPAATSPTTTTTPSSVPTGGSKTTPNTQGDSSDASSSKLPHFTLISALFYISSHALVTFTTL